MLLPLFSILVNFQVGWGIKKSFVACIGFLCFLVVVVVVVGCLGSSWNPQDGPF